jgi:putative oxidoreductase
MQRRLVRITRWVTSGIDTLPPPAEIGLFMLRVYVGLALIWTVGSGRIDWRTLQLDPTFLEIVTGLGFPAPVLFAYLVALCETVGAVFFALGLGTRVWAALLAITLGVAAFGYNHVPFLRVLHITQLLFWVFVCFALLGSGRLSLDGWIRRRMSQQGLDRLKRSDP